MSYDNLFKNAQYCYQAIIDARKVFTNSKSTAEQVDNIYKMLGLMYIHCREELEKPILATMAEIDQRILCYKWSKIRGVKQ